MKLQDKVAVITGVGSGIGRAAAIRYAEEDACVIGFELHEENLKKTMKEITGAGGKGHPVQGSAAVRKDLKNAVDMAMDTYGRLDVMVNVVGRGTLEDYGIERLSEDALNDVITMNAKTTLWGCQLAAEIMKKQGSGSIINVASVTGLFGSGLPMYAMAKGGLVSFTRTLAIELAKCNVRCNVVAPGSIDSPAWGDLLAVQPDLKEKLVELIPMHRMGTPEDIAAMIAFLGSDDAAYITGTVQVIDGGMTIGSTELSELFNGIKYKIYQQKTGKSSDELER